MTNDEQTPRDLANKYGRTSVLRGVLQGTVPAAGRISNVSLRNFVDGLEGLATSIEQAESRPSKSGEVYVMSIELGGVTYLTTVIEGKPSLSALENGKIDLDNLQEQNLVGTDSLETVVMDIFSGSTHEDKVAEIKKDKPKQVFPPEHRKPPQPRVKKPKPKFILDPLLIQTLTNKRNFLESAAFLERRSAKRRISSEKELREIVSDGTLATLKGQGYNCTCQPIVGLVAGFRSALQKKYSARVMQLLGDEAVGDSIGRYIAHVIGDEKDFNVATEFFLKAENARDGINYFNNPANRPGHTDLVDMIGVLRHYAFGAVKGDDELTEKMDYSMHAWLQSAQCVNAVTTDQNLQEVVKLFDQAKGRGQGFSHSDNCYEGMRLLLHNMIHDKVPYDVREIEFIVNGLWYLGHLPKSSSKSTDGADRSPKGAQTIFSSPARHYLQRLHAYKPVLMEAFENMRRLGKVDNDLELTCRKDDHKLALQLYDHVPDTVRAETFRSLVSGKPLDGPAQDGKRNRGHQMKYVLEYFVGTHREELLSKLNG